jgi:hypothetical protein
MSDTSSTVSTVTAIWIGVFSGLGGAILTGAFGLLNGWRQRVADRDALNTRHSQKIELHEKLVEEGRNAERLGRLRDDLAAAMGALLVFQRVVKNMWAPGGLTQDIADEYAEATKRFNEAATRLALDYEGSNVAQQAVDIANDMRLYQFTIDMQLQLVQSRSQAAIDHSEKREKDEQDLLAKIDRAIEVVRRVASGEEKLTETPTVT